MNGTKMDEIKKQRQERDMLAYLNEDSIVYANSV